MLEQVKIKNINKNESLLPKRLVVKFASYFPEQRRLLTAIA